MQEERGPIGGAGGGCGVEASRSAAVGESTGVGLFTCRPGGAGGRAAESLGRLLAGNVLSSTPHEHGGRISLLCTQRCPSTNLWKKKKCLCVVVAQLCPILCDPMDCGLPGSFVHGIFQTRIPERVAILYPRGSSRPRDLDLLHCRQILYCLPGRKNINICKTKN